MSKKKTNRKKENGHGGPRAPGEGKRIGRPPIPARARAKKRQVYLSDDDLAVVAVMLRKHAGAVGETGGQVLADALRRLAAGEWLPRRVEVE